MAKKNDPLKPSPALLCKLGSVVVHAEELTSPDGYSFDVEAFLQLIADPEVSAWLKAMTDRALVPLKRRA